jgi:hypothetical protein
MSPRLVTGALAKSTGDVIDEVATIEFFPKLGGGRASPSDASDGAVLVAKAEITSGAG